jgi:recombinational DNA repair protein RecR
VPKFLWRILSRLRGFIWWQVYQFLYLDVTDNDIEDLQKQVRNLYETLDEPELCEICGNTDDECHCDKCDCGKPKAVCNADKRFYEYIGVSEWQIAHMTVEQENRLEKAINDIFD